MTEADEAEADEDTIIYRTVVTVEGDCIIIAQYHVDAGSEEDGAEFVVVIPLEQWPLISNAIDTLIASNTTTMEQKKRRLS